jgi:hypothetical protein
MLIARWTGSTWKQEAVPGIPGVWSVGASSVTNAWAVGASNAGSLILHWNGKTWS